MNTYTHRNVKTNLRAAITFAFLFVDLALASCCFSTPSITTTRIQPEWVKEWLTQPDPNCQSPCFQGITPGITKIQEAQLEVKKIADIHNVTNISYDPVSRLKEFEWDYKESGGARVVSEQNTDLVEMIIIGFSKTSEEKYGLKFGDVVSKFGPPSRVDLAEPMGSACDTLIYYIEKGMQLEYGAKRVFRSNSLLAATLSSEDLLDTIIFSLPIKITSIELLSVDKLILLIRYCHGKDLGNIHNSHFKSSVR